MVIGEQHEVGVSPELRADVFWFVVESAGAAPYQVSSGLNQGLGDTLGALSVLAGTGTLVSDKTDLYRLNPSDDPQSYVDILCATSPERLVRALDLKLRPKRLYTSLERAVRTEIESRLQRLDTLITDL